MTELLNALQANLSFVLTVLGIFLGLVLIALLAEKTICRRSIHPRGARYLAICAMCAALSGLLMVIELPVFFAPGFYKLDLSELPVLFCGFCLGPVAGVVCQFLKVVVKLLLKGTTTAFVGDFANFAVGCALILPASIVYHCKRTKRGAIIALVTGTACMTIFGSFFNAVYLLPKFSALFGMPMDAIIEAGRAVNPAITSVSTLVLFAVVPLNLLKGSIVSVLTFALYKRVRKVLIKE
ncbi:MAG: ECF transporter S component [Ruminococcaceae bacterium]|nr:ECF transporter S component [Oscillospiraceae bacterium]